MIKSNFAIKAGSVALAVLTTASLMGCGSSNQAASAKNDTKTQTTASPASATEKPTSNDKVDNVYIVIEPGAKLGSDGKLHDAFINGDIKVTAGKPVTLNFYNYDDGTHTYTSKDLGLDVKIKASTKKGEPAVTTYTFTPKQEGTYSWLCADICDGGNNQWAMTQEGYMQGKITVLPASNNVQYISMVINPDYKLGPDGKLHDAYTNGDVTVNVGQPVELTIYNYGKNNHDFGIGQLNVKETVNGRKALGDPTITVVKFTPDKAGKYQWNCLVPCDGANGNFAMANDNYMMGFIEAK